MLPADGAHRVWSIGLVLARTGDGQLMLGLNVIDARTRLG